VSSSVLLVAGGSAVLCGIGLLWATARIRRRLESTHRLLDRLTATAGEVERVEFARRQLDASLGATRAIARGGATGVNEVVRRSSQMIAGVPYAILEGIGRVRRRNDPD
jgi:hypothetical protein